MNALDKIEIYEEVNAIRKHFQTEVVLKILKGIEGIAWPCEIRDGTSYEAEDHGHEVARLQATEIVADYFQNI